MTEAPQHMHPEFSRRVAVASLPADGREMVVAADVDERRALADRFGLAALHRLAATVTIRPLGGGRGVTRAEVTGTLEAEVEQTCVVTLQPLSRTVQEALRVRFSDEAGSDVPETALDFDPAGDDDPPDPILDGEIDLGEVLAEALGLALDPHPRADGVAFDATAWTGAPVPQEEEKVADGPFAALAAIKARSRSS
ncbi:YceD family protein [Rhodospira trueperi]|uniref:Uncharacterized ACR, COG1399 n=1 Tax=Rhodospira trueperi TaxID=69960 RepID=A0A1G6WVN6_9PROT|nr:DUF177 domain-containing protein [Rhodospira trueperi]SDD69085.1 Uncharacterized ACR, COG1399 [Rhodospira trueperi]